MSKDPNVVVSVVAALHNDETFVTAFVKDLSSFLDRHYEYFEIVLVDDGSEDLTRQKVSEFLGEIQRVRFLRLSRSFGKDVALSAGIESALGDVVITLDPRTDPIERIPDFVAEVRKTGGVVHGVSDDLAARGALREAAGGIFRRYCGNLLGITLTRGAADFRGMSRAAVNALLQVKLQNRYLRVLTATLGYEQSELHYRATGNGDRNVAFFSEVATGLDLIAAHTKHPLRIVTWGGVGAAFVALFYAVYALVIFFVRDDVAAGWTTLSLLLSSMFFVLFVILAVLGEYVGTILNEVRGRPLYFVAEEKNSSVLLEDTVQTSLVSDSSEH